MEIGRLKYDVLFKKVFHKKHLLKAFLNTVLKQELSSPITDLSYEPTDFIIEGKSLLIQKSKHDVIDVFCITQQKERILIELQKGYNKRALPRFLDYQCRNYSSQFRRGSDYAVVVPCYSICWFFDMKPPHKKVKETITLSSNCKKTDWHFKWKIIALYPQNIPKSHLEQQKIDQLEEWLLLDIIEDVEISQEIQQFFNTQEVKEAFKTLDLSDLSEEQFRRIMFEDHILQNTDLYEEKLKKRDKERDKKRNLEIAKNLLAQQIDIKVIMQSTGLNKDEITALMSDS
ncbi:Rpn family recombination-promoting nuclease/putative transposase [Candidatus Parabeggiatoa sp. HSG14]|uniref:Rpn family recombination-promoting nuclease/putative transposase n=1 Tax=Candidatus Parabeggiatoa sp. HSG14 TaxID=3055593 RepID=UPI0025A6C27F|nr:Rpn family recombination-promoting nuclease/putative transposase [Thiotrichales bacterium HSG14]